MAAGTNVRYRYAAPVPTLFLLFSVTRPAGLTRSPLRSAAIRQLSWCFYTIICLLVVEAGRFQRHRYKNHWWDKRYLFRDRYWAMIYRNTCVVPPINLFP